MSCVSTFEQVKRIVKEQLGVEEDEIQMSSTLVGDLGADSLDIVELIMAFEEEFNIEIPDEQAERIRTVGDIVKYINDPPEFVLPPGAHQISEKEVPRDILAKSRR